MKDKQYLKEYERLNPRQQEAVDTIEGPVMVIAGPGTGKTQIMAMRVANILRTTQIAASNILVLTFTESGVHALKERLLKIVGPPSYQVHIHTFHSFCNEVILTFPEKFLFSKTLNHLSDLEEIKILQEIIRQESLELLKPLKSPFHYQSAILKAIGDLKQEGIAPEKFLTIINKEIEAVNQNEDNFHQKGASEGKMKAAAQEQLKQLQKNLELAKVYAKYEEELKNSGKYDYADMILFVLEAFKSDPVLLSFYQEKFQYILVDEYQDTNSAQNEVVQILASFYDDPNVFVVGDDEQSIYRFQGAALENILYFTQTYPDAKIIVLDKNYRSGQLILDTSRALIKNNQNQIFNRLKIEKQLESQLERTKGEIYLGEFSSGSIESFFIAKKIKEMIKKGAKPSEIAILYRQHQDVLELTDFLAKLEVPYRLEIGTDILDDPEITKILKILKVLDFGPQSEQANFELFEIMHYPFFKIPALDVYKVSQYASSKHQRIIDTLINEEELASLKLKKPGVIKKFAKKLFEIAEFSANHTFADTFEYVINETCFLDYLIQKEDAVQHLNRLQSLFNEIKNLNIKNKELNIHSFREFLSDLEENNLSIKANEIEANFEGVNLMTAHKSKGLEFETVFILKLVEGHWGNRTRRELIKLPAGLLKVQTDITEQDEEERRLFYVALTRAKKSIYLTYAQKYGDSENLSIPSKFLAELPEDLLVPIETEKYEKQFDERLKLSFSLAKWHPTKAIDEFLKGLLRNFSLSATSFNAYLECPHKFFLDNLLRVPKTKTPDQAYGTAVHRALEMLYRGLQKDGILPPKNKFIEYYQESLTEEILNQKDYDHLLKEGVKTLEQYYDYYLPSFRSPMSLEYSFSPHQVHFKDIPITGKIDKIDILDLASHKVKVTDYKTSKPKSLNYLQGETKEGDTSYLYQAYFYKLLAEQDKLFNWNVAEIEFDFLNPEKDKFTRVSVPIDKEKYNIFKSLVTETYQRINALDFSHNKDACKKHNRDCPYKDFCK